MLRSKQMLELISFRISLLEVVIKNNNAIGFFDLNVVAEDFFVRLLNAVYGYQLKNLNHSGLNKAAIDLGDLGEGIAFQVTSERSKKKIQGTLDTFVRHGLEKEYKSLKVLIIGERTGKYPTLVVPASIEFCGSEDIVDIRSLLRDVRKLEPTILSEIAKLVEREIPDVESLQKATSKTRMQSSKRSVTKPIRTKFIDESIHEISIIFNDAMRLKDLIRTSPKEMDNALEAAAKFEEAASMIHNLLSDESLANQDRAKLQAYMPYYRYEAKSCSRAWSYENHRCPEALSAHNDALEYLEDYIDKLVQFIDEDDETFDKLSFEKQLDVAYFIQEQDIVFRYAIDARAAIDRDDFIAAIDIYKVAVKKLDDVLKLTQVLDNKTYHRVIQGSRAGFLGNIAIATVNHLEKIHQVPSRLPLGTAVEIIRQTMQAYKAGMEASRLNPEWEQYLGYATLCRQGIVEQVKTNEEFLPEIWAEFHDDVEFVRILKQVDPTTIVQLESGSWKRPTLDMSQDQINEV